jgi:hypothetical protein
MERALSVVDFEAWRRHTVCTYGWLQGFKMCIGHGEHLSLVNLVWYFA